MEFRLKGNLLNWEVKFGGRKGEVEGVCVCVCVCRGRQTGRDREETPEERKGSNVWRMLRTQCEYL